MNRVATRFAPEFAFHPIATFMTWVELTQQRRALSKLDAAALSDIGLSQSAADREAARGFWDAPDHWTK